MSTCRACGGVLGRDCFNEEDCLVRNVVWEIADRLDKLLVARGFRMTSQVVKEMDYSIHAALSEREEKVGKLESAAEEALEAQRRGNSFVQDQAMDKLRAALSALGESK